MLCIIQISFGGVLNETLIISIFFSLLTIYRVTLNVTGETHAKSVIVIRSEFGSGLLAGFTKPLSVLEMLYLDTRGNINNINAVIFHCEATQIRCRSNCKCCRVTAIQTDFYLQEGEGSKLQLKGIKQ
jgi:hypothetical protein